MFDHFKDWVESVLGAAFQYSAGMWVDNAVLNDLSICAIHQTPGPAPDVDDRRQRFRVILLGPRNKREAWPQVKTGIEALSQAALGDSAPCGAASVRAITEPMGPGYTNENRAWFSLDFEVLF